MRIYRMEDENGIGPFTQGDMQDYPSNAFPTPLRDGLSFRLCDEVCGCTNKRDFIKWFPKLVRIDLQDLGYRVKVYHIPANQIRHGGMQSLFTR